MDTTPRLELVTRAERAPKPRFCGPACKDGLKADRKAGLIYPSFRLSDLQEAGFQVPASKVLRDFHGASWVSWETATAIMGECSLCRADLDA